MRTRTAGLGLVALLTLAATALADSPATPPAPTPPKSPTIQVVFVVDTTGSMSGLIDGAKRKVWAIANEILAGKPRPRLSIGLVAYRDRGDAYVTQVTQPTEDLDAIYKSLMAFRADGGGDGPEHVNKALSDAFSAIEWSPATNLKLVYLVGDAPAHRDYDKQVDYAKVVPPAHEKGIVVNAVLCGGNGAAKLQFQEIARLGGGEFFQIDQSGGMVAVSTPYDEQLLELQRKLERTRISYGTAVERTRDDAKMKDALEMDDEAGAARASARCKAGMALSRRDLVDTWKRGKLDEVPEDKLPPAFRKLGAEERAKKLAGLFARRTKLHDAIAKASRQRDAWLREQAPRDGFDGKVLESLKRQAGKAGIRYE